MPKLINEEVHKLVTEAYDRTKNILPQNKKVYFNNNNAALLSPV